LSEATIFFKHTLWLNVKNCLRGKTFLGLEVSTTSQSSTRKVLFKFANKWVKRKASRNRNEVCPFRRNRWRVMITQTQVCASQMQSYLTRTPAVVFW